jgi:hypothetical protein
VNEVVPGVDAEQAEDLVDLPGSPKDADQKKPMMPANTSVPPITRA